MRAYVHWTTHELRLMKSLHESGISRAEFVAKFPRHTEASVTAMATKQGVWLKPYKVKPDSYHLQWLRIAHRHFARREQGLLA